MKEKTQKEKLEDMLKRPIPKKKIGIIHLEMVKESRCLYGMRRFTDPKEAVETVRPLYERADRELLFVLSLNAKLEPQALEIAAVGGVEECALDVRSIFKHALLNNASSVMCFHNHPSGDSSPSPADKRVTRRIEQAGKILGVELVDHIILGDKGTFYSFRQNGELPGMDEAYSAQLEL